MPRLYGEDPVEDSDPEDEEFPESPETWRGSPSPEIPADVFESTEDPEQPPLYGYGQWRPVDEDGLQDDISEQTLDGEYEYAEGGGGGPDIDGDFRPHSVSSSDSKFLASRNALTIELPTSTLINPRSAAVNYKPPLAITKERRAVDVLVGLADRLSLDPSTGSNEACTAEYIYIDLDEFEIYHNAKGIKNRLRPLHALGAGRNGDNIMLFDGVISVGETRFYVQHVPFAKTRVDKYGVDNDTVRGHINIRSKLNGSREIYYRLRTPSTVYARFFNPYLWVADLGKHFIDYCNKMTDRDRDVRISHFRAHFSKWLNKTHPRSAAVEVWRAQYGRDDFRQAVVAYGDYLRKEASTALRLKVAGKLGVFREIQCEYYKTHKPSIPKGLPVGKKKKRLAPLPTAVTPYMHSMFGDMAIGSYLKSTPGRFAPKMFDHSYIMLQGQAPFITGLPDDPSAPMSPSQRIKEVQPGDVISTLPDGKMTGSKWPSDAEKSKYWYALVHRVIMPKRHKDPRSYDVVWMYRPEHTPCRQMKYPWPNELFLSDHCTCEEKDDDEMGDDESPFEIQESQVAGVHSVEWFGGPGTKADFFVRQTYLHGERSWVQLRLGHIFCKSSASYAKEGLFASYFGRHGKPFDTIGCFEDKPDYVIGDTVLAVLSDSDTRSEPYEIEHRLDKNDGEADGRPSGTVYRLRRLLRRNEIDSSARDAPPNEVVYTNQVIAAVKESQITGRCLVRIFKQGAKIATPYDRGGTGNAFFMTHRITQTTKTICAHPSELHVSEGDHLCVPLDAANDAPQLRQGFDPATPVPRLRALDLFCGCGNLGRGLEDSGATETRFANDIWPVAMHTFMANVASTGAVEPFIGSADTLLEQVICRRPGVPARGDIDFISGGSPCQGFSPMTPDKSTPEQFKNRSMVASFASFVDVYRPKYGILENVVAIVNGDTFQKHKDDEGIDEEIFWQLIGALLGLGYQLRLVLGNAWSYGAPQHRQRVFVLFTAPGQRRLEIPLPSHASPGGRRGGSRVAVGRLLTGERIIDTGYEGVPTAFPFVSAEQATADLRESSEIDDGLVDICVRHPDHRITIGVSDALRHKIANIPTQPYGLGLAEVRRTDLSAAVAALFSKKALKKRSTRAYKRVHPSKLFGTVRTQCGVADARSAGDLHWQAPRPLTVLEMRRAQGIPDHEVLLFGTKPNQWKMVGNAVARQIALALGLSLRAAWLGTLCEPREPCKQAEAHAVTTTTTTMTLVALQTTTTTSTTNAVPGPAPPPKLSSLPLPLPTANLPFKQNRIFQTSVHTRRVVSGGDTAAAGSTGLSLSQSSTTTLTAMSTNSKDEPSDDDDDDDKGPLKRSRSLSLSLAAVTAKRLRGEGSVGGSSRAVTSRNKENEVIVID